MDEAYYAGKNGTEYSFEGHSVEPGVARVMYEAGKQDANVLNNGQQEVYNEVNNTETEGNINGTEGRNVYLRNGSQWDRGQDTGEQLRQLGGRTGENQAGQVTARPKDAGAASLNLKKEKVNSLSLGIKGGTNAKNISLIESGETEAMTKAREIAAERGLKTVFFAGDNLKLYDQKSKKYVYARGAIQGDTIYVRVDHSEFTAEQIAKHEAGHDMIAKGEVSIEDVRNRLIADGYDIDSVVDLYEAAYRGAKLNYNELLEEIICDSIADMNIFEGKVEVSTDYIGKVSSAVEQTKTETDSARAPPADDSVKLSRQIGHKKKGSVYSEFNTFAMQWARSDKTEVGEQKLFYNKAKWTLLEKTEDGYIELGNYSNSRFDSIKKEVDKHNEDLRGRTDEQIYTGVMLYEAFGEYNTRDMRNVMGKQTSTGQGSRIHKAQSSSDGSPDNKSGLDGSAIKLSREIDTEYLAAVKRGDMETAQRMVDEAAKAAGYTYKGMHGTSANFNSFDYSYIGDDNKLGLGFYFTNNEKLQFKYDYKKTAYLKFNNPIFDNNPLLDDILQIEEELRELGLTQEETIKTIQKKFGYDGIVAQYNRKALVAFNPEQIKSADPVTYDDNGNVIPLSQRFNENETDIRYSLEFSEDSPLLQLEEAKTALKENDAEIKKLRKQLENAKGQTKLTPRPSIRKTKIN